LTQTLTSTPILTPSKAFQRSNLILRCFLCEDPHMLYRAFVAYVRPLLQYCSKIWSPSDITYIKQSQKRPKVFGCAQIISLLNTEQNHSTRLPIVLPMRNVGRANLTDLMRYLVRSQTCCVVCHTCRFFQPPALTRFIAGSSPLCGHYTNGLLTLMIFF
jgi:hypothetical protein